MKTYQVPIRGKHFLNVVDSGHGPAVLLVHGGAGSWANFTHQVRDLSQRFRVLAPDLRGHGASPWPGPSDVDDFYQDLATLIARLDLPPEFHLVGHSFGGYLAARFSAERPERILSLALLNTSGDLPQGLAYRFLETFSGGADLFHHYYPWMVSTGSEVARCLMRRTLKQWNSWDLFPRIQAPTLVILGARDPLIPVRRGREMAGRIPKARLEVLPTGGHVSMAEQPETVTRWLSQHMDQVPAVRSERTAGHSA